MQPSNLSPYFYPPWLRCAAVGLLACCLPIVIVAAMFGVSVSWAMIIVAGCVSSRALSVISGRRFPDDDALPTLRGFVLDRYGKRAWA